MLQFPSNEQRARPAICNRLEESTLGAMEIKLIREWVHQRAIADEAAMTIEQMALQVESLQEAMLRLRAENDQYKAAEVAAEIKAPKAAK